MAVDCAIIARLFGRVGLVMGLAAVLLDASRPASATPLRLLTLHRRQTGSSTFTSKLPDHARHKREPAPMGRRGPVFAHICLCHPAGRLCSGSAERAVLSIAHCGACRHAAGGPGLRKKPSPQWGKDWTLLAVPTRTLRRKPPKSRTIPGGSASSPALSRGPACGPGPLGQRDALPTSVRAARFETCLYSG